MGDIRRCDRCKQVLVILDNKLFDAKQVLLEIDGRVIVNYVCICPNCEAHVMTLAKRMGVIDRTKGGRKKKK